MSQWLYKVWAFKRNEAIMFNEKEEKRGAAPSRQQVYQLQHLIIIILYGGDKNKIWSWSSSLRTESVTVTSHTETPAVQQH